MTPVEIYVGEEKMWTSSETGGVYSKDGLRIQYFGDEFGGYGITMDGQPLDSGALTREGQQSPPVEVSQRKVKHIDAGQPPTPVRKYLRLRRT